MGPDSVIQIGSEAVKMVLLISLPMLAVALVVGIAISLFQALTQIQEMTLTFVPKIIAVFGAMIIAAPWMTERMITFTRDIFNMIPTLTN
ncbi:flagellar biosynthetic protein FliQ [Mariprofundus sp. EBB-1]|uniref:flagellar biosynthesis protein FliQ n=1 Tax=Mariprofundus sp. EBB-1 TaxID=2650971 RepID=UPI000EF21C8C|nr:flagellar biosynthesis protein FliQ [Mariprofundus sp. EBB-1]RLL51082.1 flagellar biosynthetic protein FliQ [Mariprofundus sp. EBB-1]